MEPALVKLSAVAIDVLSPVVIILATWLAHRLVALIERKTKIDLPAKQEAQIDAWVEQAIRYAEEKAYAAAKHKASKVTGPEKLEAAAGFAFDLAEKNGWIEWTRDRLKAKIEAKLNVVHERPGSPAGQ